MELDNISLKDLKSLLAVLNGGDKTVTATPPQFNNPVVAQFIGRFVFVCNLEIKDGYCYLKKVRNVRYWSSRDNGLGDLAKNGKNNDDKIDEWPDQIIPLDKLGPVMEANPDVW